MDNSLEPNANWRTLYKLAAVAALLVVVAGLLDIVMAMLSGEARENSSITVLEWFTLFQTKPISAFSNLGLLNILYQTLAIPLYLALYHLHAKLRPAFAGLAFVLFCIGATVYFSTNTVFPMYALSRQFAAATSDLQKASLLAAGESALAMGADLTPGVFLGFFFAELAGIMMAFVLLRSGIFSRITAWLGILAMVCMLIFNAIAAFVPAWFGSAMILGMLGGPLSMAYYILLARRLFQLSR